MDPNRFRRIPSVHELLASPPVAALATRYPSALLTRAARQEQAELRRRLIEDGTLGPLSDEEIEAACRRVAERVNRAARPRLVQVINATGIILHTNLGRSPIAAAAAEAASSAATGYLNLEFDLETGQRISRQETIRAWLSRLTGAESGTAVNNNAAAVVLALRVLCPGKEAVISRGQLIEIGGGFRIPEIMAVSGAVLREVGTTNITRLADYERALGPATGALLHVHTSNYRVIGFTESVCLGDLVALGRRHNVPVIDDIGSGALLDFSRFGFDSEPVAGDSIANGADLVLFSGDKLLGGPQAGILVGRRALIERIERDPLMRAVRIDKMTLAALEATLRLYMDETDALSQIPILRMLATPVAELQRRAEACARSLHGAPRIAVLRARPDEAFAGGGSLPAQAIPTYVLEIEPEGMGEDQAARRLRLGTPAVVSRIREGKVILDLRTVFPEDDERLIGAVRQAFGE